MTAVSKLPLQIKPSVTHCLCALALLGAAAFSIKPVQANDTDLQPEASYSPEQVVRIVIDALKNNESIGNDEGIATVFRFASPGNRANTGPLRRFTRMIKQGFPDMLHQIEARFDPIEINENSAVQAVWLLQPDGREIGYVFRLGKQKIAPYENIWMTEVVAPLGESQRSGTRI